jgi:hypothetical protein
MQQQQHHDPFTPFLLAKQGTIISDGGMGTLLESLLEGGKLDPQLW